MEPLRQDRRGGAPDSNRAPFGALANAAIRKHFRESRVPEAFWQAVPNLGWTRWAREDGLYIYCGIRRNIDWITGELGVAQAALDLDQLTLVAAPLPAPDSGCRMRLGQLLHGQDRWWSFGGNEAGLIERLNWISLQMRLRLFSFLSATAPPPD